MRRIIVSLMFALLLLWSAFGLRHIATQTVLGGDPIVLAGGGSRPPPVPRDGGN